MALRVNTHTQAVSPLRQLRYTNRLSFGLRSNANRLSFGLRSNGASFNPSGPAGKAFTRLTPEEAAVFPASSITP